MSSIILKAIKDQSITQRKKMKWKLFNQKKKLTILSDRTQQRKLEAWGKYKIYKLKN